MTQFPRTFTLGVAIVSAIALARCGQTPLNSPTSPTAAGGSTAKVSGPIGSPGDGDPTTEYLQICKTADSDLAGTFTVSSSAASGTFVPTVTVQPGTCVIAVLIGGSGADYTVTETSSGLQSATFNTLDTSSGSPVYTSGAYTNGSTLHVGGSIGHVLSFKNVNEPPPPGNQGCTPGYWRQAHHYDSWTGYAPGDDFDATFGVNFFTPNITLGTAVALGGGGVNALARHAVAALLSAASAGVNYPYSTADVIAIVQGTGAYAGLSVEARKNLLAAANELGCPLN
ncbi:MAG: hypothetical protein AB7O28_16445 [Vicinamibacterales bacterium]